MLQPLEEKADAVDAGEDEPIVIGQGVEGRVEFPIRRRRHRLDRREPEHFGPARFQQFREPACLIPRTGDRDAFPEQRFGLEPRQTLAEPHHVAHDDDRWRLKFFLRGALGYRAHGPGQYLLVGLRPPADEGHRCVRGQATRHQALHDAVHLARSHQNNQRAAHAGEGRRVHAVRGVIPHLWTVGHHGHAWSVVTMGERNAGIRGNGRRRRHTRHDLERNPGRGEFLGLLAATSEQRRVAAREPHDCFALRGLLAHQPADGLPRHAASAGLFPGVEQMRVRLGEIQDADVDEGVMDDHVRVFQATPALEGQQSRVAGAGAYQIDFARRGHRSLRPCPFAFQAIQNLPPASRQQPRGQAGA